MPEKFVALRRQAAGSSETSVLIYHSTLRHVQKDSNARLY